MDKMCCCREDAHVEFHQIHKRKDKKSERRMPRLLEAKKDAASCEKSRVSASMK